MADSESSVSFIERILKSEKALTMTKEPSTFE